MSSEISISGPAKAGPHERAAGPHERAAGPHERAAGPHQRGAGRYDEGAGRSDNHDALQPWQLFTLAGLAGATTVVFVTRETGPAGVILLSLTVGAAAWTGLAAWRTLAPLFGFHVSRTTEVLGGRTRAALERDKALVLRAIRDLEFDRAMKKVSDKDFAEMNARLRARAAGILKQLDRGAGYRDEIERELEKRLGITAAVAGTKVPPYEHKPAGPNVSSGEALARPNVNSGEALVDPKVNVSSGRTCSCGTPNDIDARFCKTCGTRLEAA
jgi:hypothetical protein